MHEHRTRQNEEYPGSRVKHRMIFAKFHSRVTVLCDLKYKHGKTDFYGKVRKLLMNSVQITF